LLTGFEPFGAHSNPSELLVRSLDGRAIGGRTAPASAVSRNGDKVWIPADDENFER
jgi:pyrrolidone-carboxylate peptidase